VRTRPHNKKETPMKKHPRGSHRVLGVAASAALFSVFSLTACGGGTSSQAAPPPPAAIQGVTTPSQISVVTAK
jgi:hypothetical protein